MPNLTGLCESREGGSKHKTDQPFCQLLCTNTPRFDSHRKIKYSQSPVMDCSREEARRGEVDLKTDDHVPPPMLSLEGLNSNERPNGRAAAQNVDRAGKRERGRDLATVGEGCLGVS